MKRKETIKSDIYNPNRFLYLGLIIHCVTTDGTYRENVCNYNVQTSLQKRFKTELVCLFDCIEGSGK